jgi:effector-binding domain-containing protein
MDTTYEAITNFLDEKGIDAKELFIEEYVTDPVATPEDKLVVEIFVPVK